MKVEIYNNDCLNQLDMLEENSIDSIVTDPPYGLTSIVKRFGKESSAPAQYGKDGSFARLSKGFMGKEWDGSGIEYNVEMWNKCLKVLKPGGYLLAFGGSRTFHRIACAIEDAGFEIRDTIMWLYGSGFPKSQNIGNAVDKKNGIDNRTGKIIQGMGSNNTESMNNHKYETQNYKKQYEEREAQNKWRGWGTCLKPSFEPIIVARKPFKGSLVDNVIKYGVGGINIDECRVGNEERTIPIHSNDKKEDNTMFNLHPTIQHERIPITEGRFPANTILTYDETDFEEVCGGFPYTKSKGSNANFEKTNQDNPSHLYTNIKSGVHFEDSGSASRYFYCAKASKKDRDEGLDEFEQKQVRVLNATNPELENKDDVSKRFITIKKNIHPTVKPTSLMQYLVRLVTPKGGTILDPFMGSGSTGKAVMFENKERNSNYSFIGIEKEKEYCDIARARIEWAKNYQDEKEDKNQVQINEFGELF